MTDDLLERARRDADIEAVAGVTLRRAGKDKVGMCPLCLVGAKSKSPPFKIYPAKGRFRCWRCNRGGSVIDLEHMLRSSGSETIRDAALRLVNGAPMTDVERERRAQVRAAEERAAVESEAWKAALAAQLWREGQPAGGTLAQTYLEHRGWFGPVLARALMMLRFHPRAYWGGHPQFGVFLPAMIGLVTTEFGATGGVHVTYLAPDGRGKARRDPAKKMFGPQGMVVDGRPYPGGVWLTRPDAPGPLVVGEGIESTGARAIIKAGDLQTPVRAVATASLDRMQGGEKAGDDGAIDVWSVTPDPARPPFTWPEDPQHPWGEVEIATDGDMRPQKVMGRSGRRGRATPYVRDGAERARVCGTLAKIAWGARLAPDSATRVRATRAPIGRDFADELLMVTRRRAGPPATPAAGTESEAA